jgi:anti-anti-sigma factor
LSTVPSRPAPSSRALPDRTIGHQRATDAARTTETAAGSLSVAVRTGDAPDVTRLVVAGEIDISTVEVLRTALTAAAEAAAQVHIDLSHVSFCDCAGVNVLLAARRAHPATVVIEASPMVRQLFDLTDVTDLLTSGTAA